MFSIKNLQNNRIIAMQPRRGAGWVLIFIMALLLVTGCSSARNRKIKIKPKPSTGEQSPSPTPSPEISRKPAGPIEFKGSTLQSREGNRKNWQLTAKEVTYDEGKKIATAQVVECVFFNTANEKVLTVTAKGAKVEMSTKSLRFLGTVSAVSEKGEKMEIKKLRWDGENKKLIGEGRIKITRKGAVLTANHMSADPEMKKLELSEDVLVTYPEADKFLKF